MTFLPALLLAVTMLDGPEVPVVDAEVARRADADAGAARQNYISTGEKTAVITAERSDFDRESKVVMFEKNVSVRYAKDFELCANRLFVFLDGSNRLERIVAIGNVAITNETRVGTCAMAKFWKLSNEIDMYGERGGAAASLTDEAGNDVAGSLIRFWLDSEQVDVTDPEIRVRKKEGGKLL